MGPDTQPRLVTLASFSTPVEAEIARGLLLSEGIEAFLRDHQTVSVAPHLSGVIGGVRLEVLESEAEQAQVVLAEGLPSPDPDDRQVYRIVRSRALAVGMVTGAVAVAVVLLLGLSTANPVVALFMVLSSSGVGLAWGGGMRRGLCSDVSCGTPLTTDLMVCPGCARPIADD